MSEFVDPIKNVKRKVKFLEEASSIIKGSRRQQLERQREIKGLEVAKTEEYTKQAQPIIEAIGTLPSTEEKRVLKEASRNIVSNELISNSIPKIDPSYNIVLKLFDDSYDIIQGRKTQLLKERDINLMVESIQSIIGDVLPLDGTPYTNVYENSSPISSLAKHIFEKVFFNKEYTLTADEKADIILHEEAIQDREKTELEKSALESEAKVEEEGKNLKERTSKFEAILEVNKIIEENKINEELKNYMFSVYANILREEGIDINTSPRRSNLISVFNFIHPFIITEKNPSAKLSKINELVGSDIISKQFNRKVIRDKIKNALIRTYTDPISTISSVKSVKEGLLDDIKKFSFAPRPSSPAGAPAGAPIVDDSDSKPKIEIEMVGDTSAEKVASFLNTSGINEIFSTDSKGKPKPFILNQLLILVDELSNKTNLTMYERLYAKQEFLKKYFQFLTDRGKVSAKRKNEFNAELEKIKIPDEFIRTLDTPIKPSIDGRGLKNKKKAEIFGKGLKISDDPSKIDNYFEQTGDSIAMTGGKAFRVMSLFLRKLKKEIRDDWSPNDILYFKIIASQKLINLYNQLAPSETKDEMISASNKLITESLSEFTDDNYKELAESKVDYSSKGEGLRPQKKVKLVGKGLINLTPKSFENKIKKKSNEDLLHNLQVHMAEVQAGNTGLKEPIKMLLNEALGRGIMKKQIASKISKNFC